MITANELYYLNRALDGKEIYGIKPKILINENNNDIVKSLKAKKIIDNDKKLNDFSFIILKNLEKYKDAKEYLWINETSVALDNSNYLLFFTKGDDEGFEFKKTTKELMLLALVKEFEFLRGGELFNGDIDEVDIEKVEFDENIIKELAEKAPKDIIYFKKVCKNEIINYVIYYSEDNHIYKYDVLLNIKSRITSKKARREIATMLNIDFGGI